MDRLSALLVLFCKGAAVADPALWKTRQITATVMTGLIVAVVAALNAFGVQVPIGDGDIEPLAVAILVVVNTVLTLTTSKHVGLPAPEDVK